jgi:hypothetical protein
MTAYSRTGWSSPLRFLRVAVLVRLRLASSPASFAFARKRYIEAAALRSQNRLPAFSSEPFFWLKSSIWAVS